MVLFDRKFRKRKEMKGMSNKTSLYQTKAQLKKLVSELVSIPSVTGTMAEVERAESIASYLLKLPHFQKHEQSSFIQQETGDRLSQLLFKGKLRIKQLY